MPEKYRLYIDESGTHGYSGMGAIKGRYLSLTGVIVSESQNVQVLQPAMRAMKMIVADDPDDLPVLHREEIVQKSGAFTKLSDPLIEQEFNSIFLPLLNALEYDICTVVLDKQSHLDRYGKSASHPYHYCLDVLLERYVLFLESKNAKGDVIAEARGRTEDRPLMDKYTAFYEKGTFFCRPHRIQLSLTSREIKVKPKTKLISGLEFADLLSLPSKFDILSSVSLIPPLTPNFTKVIVDAIQGKYMRSVGGAITGFGKKFIK